jgi:general secretion pathway protein A
VTARAPYVGYFGLRESPFSNTPDSRFVYLGARHKKALALLLRGIQEQGGVVHLTGEIGAGKTTLCRLLLDRLPGDVHAVLIPDPALTAEELLFTVCDELGVQHERDAGRQTILDALRAHLQAARAGGRRAVLIVDEAQNLGVGALEQVRLLASLETGAQKLLEIILVGQPRLIDLLGVEVLPRLSPHITAGYHLLPFAEDETFTYVFHRLTQAGAGRDLFETGAIREVYRLSGGVPRLINAICDRALLGAHAQRRETVDPPTVRAAAHEPLVESGLSAFDRAPAGQAPPQRASTPARRPLWPWLVTAGLVINALVFGTVLVVTLPSHDAVVALPPAAVEKPAAAPRVEEPTAPVPAAAQRDTAAASPPPTAPTVHTPAPAPPIPPALTAAPEPTPPPAQAPVRQRRQQAPSGEPTMPTPATELETSEPGLKIDILVWAPDPKERMVYVNGRKYVEGEALDNGAVIEQIVEDGVVLAHHGQRILVPSDAAREPDR